MKIAVIPARGGSKRIPHKNIKPFFGKPMIAWSIEAAKESRLFDMVIVSTDDNEIAKVAEEYGAKVPFMRPAELAEDITPPEPVIKHLEYLRSVLSYPVHIVKKGNIQDDILTALAPGGNQFASAPFYTLNEQGKKGMGRRQCTREYKITPIAKKIR